MREEKLIAVDFSKNHATLDVLSYPCCLSSDKARWNGIYLEYHHHPAHETPEHYPTQHVVAIHTGVSFPYQSERRLNDRFQTEQIQEGDICIVPANTRHWTCSDTEQSFILLSFEPALLARVAYESIDPDRVEILPHFAKSDPLIHQIGLALKAELETGQLGNNFYAESAATMLSAHLLRYYSAQKPLIPQYTGGLPQYKLRQAIEYIKDHPAEDLSLQAIASEVNMSCYHFARLFKQSTGFTPHQYVIRCRISAIKRLLEMRELSMIEISDRVGFSSYSQFTTFFRKYTGITPKAYRKALN